MSGCVVHDVLGAALSARLDSTVLAYLEDIFASFEGDEEDALDALAPFLGELGVAEAAVREYARTLTARTGNALSAAAAAPAPNTIATPVTFQALAQDMDAAVAKSTAWMQVEATVNADKLSEGYASVPVASGSAAAQSRRERAAKYRAENEALAKAALSRTSAPSTFVKRHRGTTDAPVKQVVLRKIDVRVAGKTLVSDADLTLVYGRKYGLVGRNGAGKSSLLRAMAEGEIRVPDLDLLLVEQEVVGDDTPVLDAVLQADTRRTELLAQERALLSHTAADTDELARRDQELARVYAALASIESDRAPGLAASILAGLGFSSTDMARPTREFSGGWRMRIALARALFCQPDLLMLDEPTNMLDVQAVLWLEEYLRQKWTKMLLIVSHDREFLNSIVTDIVHLHDRKLVHYSGNYDRFEQTRNERLKQQQRAHEAQEAHRKHVQKFIDRFRYNANRAAQVQSRIKALKKLAPAPAVVEDPTLSFSFPQPSPLSPPIILFDKVSFGYTPEKTLLRDLTFNLDMDSRVALVGANGQGKSTILGLITGELTPTTGLRQVNSRAHIAKFSQHHMDQMPLALSPLEFLMREFPGKDQSVYRECLGRYSITGDMVFQRLATLSGGQKSRVAFAYLAMQQPHILVLDEPTNHLDIDTVSVLAEALNDFQGGVVLVSHDERLISLVCDQIWVVGAGELKFYPYDFEHYKKQLLKDLQL